MPFEGTSYAIEASTTSWWSHWFSWNYILLKYPHYRLESILVVYIFSSNVIYCHESSIIPLYWTTYLAFDLENILASNYHNLKSKFNQLPKGAGCNFSHFTRESFLEALWLIIIMIQSIHENLPLHREHNSTFGFTHSSNVIFLVNKIRNEHWNHIP